jgi:AAA domain
MRVRKFRLQHYGPFIDSGWVELSSTMNIFVGENNSGKSAVLRSFSDILPDVRHRNSQEWRTEYLPMPAHSVVVEYAGSDLDWALRRYADNGIGWFIATPSIPTPDLAERYARTEMAKPSSAVTMKRGTGEFEQPEKSTTIDGVSAFSLRFKQGSWVAEPLGRQFVRDGLPSLMTRVWQDNVFGFQALRTSPGRMGFGAPGRLDQNASNLAVQLNGLQGDRPFLFSPRSAI